MREKRKKIIAAVLLIAVVMTLMMLPFFGYVRTVHSCCGVECRVCIFATAAERIASALLLVTVAAASVVSLIADVRSGDNGWGEDYPDVTPVSLKVKLSD